MLTRDQIFAASDLTSEVVNVPEWGGEVFVRALTGDERDKFEYAMTEDRKKGKVNIRAALAARAICDASGARLFTDADIPALGGKSSAGLDRIFTVAARLSGITSSDVEELEKN